MIQPQELRIGNLVNYDTHTIRIIGINTFNGTLRGYFGIDEGVFTEFDKITPIPLTEEWLMKAGFVNGELVIGDLSFYINLDSDNAIIEMHEVYDAYIRIKRPQYLHQLQNLYFALCGEELNVEI